MHSASTHITSPTAKEVIAQVSELIHFTWIVLICHWVRHILPTCSMAYLKEETQIILKTHLPPGVLILPVLM